MRIFHLFLAFLLLLSLSCSKKSLEPSSKKRILVSLAPYTEIAQRIAGDEFLVESVVPSSSNPHSYEPTSKEVLAMSQSEIWFQMKEPFEKKITPPLLEKNPNLVLVDLLLRVDLLQKGCCSDHELADRHVWMSPQKLALQANIIQEALSKKYPEKKPLFEERCALVIQDLFALEAQLVKSLESVEKRTLLVSHPAFGYFCEEFGFSQISVEQEGKEPSPQYLNDILSKATKEKTQLVLLLPQYSNKGAKLIAQKNELPTSLIDPYSPHYFETMNKLSELIECPR